ncbi:hypothetical protein LAV72_11125 [Lysinibacillus xylanilyticus]|uniref:hypothetical protein n=1 Tax=Lysinibacillus xylanilyticus TaxID=582475 RepID=UPI002B247AD1|nr:hypothetical protein [Lysinibacillus xylanilyticus]MEB2300171.1 hypothetical protein [Lysinibacillus xylanilyticus]
MKNIEFDYYKRYSALRYDLVHFTHATPFVKKQYSLKGKALKNDESYLYKLISGIAESSLKINRYEILSRYQDHNNSPSTRNMHSCQLLFIIDNKIFFYDMYEDKFILVNSNTTTHSERKIYIIGISDILNISRYYGEFSLYLSMLDAGHVLGNVKNFLSIKGVSWQQFMTFEYSTILKKIFDIDDCIYGSFALAVERPEGELNFEKDVGKKRIAETKYFNEINSSEYVARIINNMKMGQTECYPKQYYSIDENFHISLRRNSAHNMVGNFNLNSENTLNKFEAESCMRRLNKFRNLVSVNKIRYCILERHRITFQDGTVWEKEVDFSEILYNDHQFFDLNTFKKVVVFYTEDKDVVSEGLLPILLSAGELMQGFCLYAAETGNAFRPMKNHHDSYLKRILELSGESEINYIGVLCSSPVQQIKLIT